ncbi:MAG: BamA/TamA family outer membrane protein [Melioribacteraceae bacterium]|nr:BamA/TamA family outer membrane protein [Melioribacteraceae bacterium]
MIKRILFLIFFYSTFFCQSYQDSVKIIPGKEFEANFFYKLFFGEHWRELWKTPVKLEILNLNQFGGGIKVHKVIKEGLTILVYFKGNDGRLWKFRSLKRDPVEIMPKDAQYLVVKNIIEDQASSANPVATIISAPLLTKVGLLHPTPTLCVLPEDESFGEHKEELKLLPGTIEISVDEERAGNWNFEGSVSCTPTCDLFTWFENNPNERIDATEYLKARLMDVYLGDWERNMDQWQWVQYSDINGQNKWHPVPQDKSHAFSRFDGVVPQMASYYIPQLVTFDEVYSGIENLTWNGRYIDRRVLPLVNKSEWDSVTQFLKKSLTDDVINLALGNIPREYFNLIGKEVKEALIERRNKLTEISDDYYKLIRSCVDIYASNGNDSLSVKRIDNNKTEIKIFEQNKISQPYLFTILNNSETSEVRIYLLDGDDKTNITGNVDDGIIVRVIGGTGNDRYIDDSNVDGYCLHVTPIPNAENRSIIYDDSASLIKKGSGTEFYDNYKFSDDAYERYSPKQRDRGSSFWIKPFWSYTSDEGLILALGPEYTSYGFRKEPYETRTTFWFAYQVDPKSFSFHFNSDYIKILPKLNMNIKFFRTHLLFDRFFGFGNETEYSEKLENDGYYKVGQRVYSTSVTFQYELKTKFKVGFGLSYEEISFDPEANTILAEFKDRIHGIGEYWLFGNNFSLEYDKRLFAEEYSSGFFAKAFFTFYPKTNDHHEEFYKVGFESKLKIPFNADHSSSISCKVGGENVWGKYPFFKAAFLGGKENLRGFSRERFAGDGSLFGQIELDVFLSDLNLIMPHKFGIKMFYDIGRVFEKEETSNVIHSSYGGGLWVTPLEKKIGLSFSIAKSKERTLYYMSTTYAL